METTHAPTHVQYKLRIKSILKISRPDEEKIKDVFQSVDNHKVRLILLSCKQLYAGDLTTAVSHSCCGTGPDCRTLSVFCPRDFVWLHPRRLTTDTCSAKAYVFLSWEVMDGFMRLTVDDLLLASRRSTLLTRCPSQPTTAGQHPRTRRCVPSFTPVR